MRTPDDRPIVVCCDDDPDQLGASARVLRSEPIHLVTTQAPADALQLLSTTHVAVLVSDYEMPGMNGVELCAAARERSPETVRILLTGRGTFDTAVSGINEGEVFRFLSKPVTPDRLRRAVAAAVARHREIVATVATRDALVRRERMLAELEHDFPGITRRRLDEEGRYAIESDARTRALGLGFDALLLLERR